MKATDADKVTAATEIRYAVRNKANGQYLAKTKRLSQWTPLVAKAVLYDNRSDTKLFPESEFEVVPVELSYRLPAPYDRDQIIKLLDDAVERTGVLANSLDLLLTVDNRNPLKLGLSLSNEDGSITTKATLEYAGVFAGQPLLRLALVSGTHRNNTAILMPVAPSAILGALTY